jgi:hypothetical protein
MLLVFFIVPKKPSAGLAAGANQLKMLEPLTGFEPVTC